MTTVADPGSPQPRRAFPADAYTPYGYLALPTHARRLRPVGVVRSWDAGFRWHVPSFAGGYGGHRETYRAGVRFGLDGILELAALGTASSPYHTGSLMEQELTGSTAVARVAHHVVGEHALRGELTSVAGAHRLVLHASYERLLGANGEWGESGLVGRLVDDLLVLQGFEDGEAIVVWVAPGMIEAGITSDPHEATTWARRGAPTMADGGCCTVLGARDDLVALHAVAAIPPGSDRAEWIVARGRTLGHARAELARARDTAAHERRRMLALDDDFWLRAPRLTGDWPDHWRRGLVYDLETIRMMVRPPVGIYRHAWDGMQLQSPRVVLAETAMDALVLGWADPSLAQGLLLGTFLDAPEPNVPCSREDGSYNMVAADGTVCGTSPAWGYPLLVASLLDRMRPDDGWVARLYPPLAAFLRWWLTERRDGSDFLGYACSWESGQDLSPRFGEQPLGGGHPIRHIRPVDLEAAMAHGAGVLAIFARRLGREDEAAAWTAESGAAASRVALLWGDGHWVDVDGRTGCATGVDDVMQAVPLALGVARADQASDVSLADWLGRLVADRPVWPMFAWTGAEALRAAGRLDEAGALAHAVIDRAYGFRDARRADPGLPIPGICAEYWPADGRGGGEGYGWGAFTTHLLLSGIVGIRHARSGTRIQPWLPAGWRGPGSAYGVTLTQGGRTRRITIRPQTDGFELDVDAVTTRGAWGDALDIPMGGHVG